MEVLKNRYGNDRVITKLDDKRIRVMGESLFSRIAEDENKNITMFDFEGGPCLNLGGKIKFMGSEFKIESIQPEKSEGDLSSVLLGVSL